MKFLIIFFSLGYISYSQNSINQNINVVDQYFRNLEAFGLSGSLLIAYKDQIVLNKNYGRNDSLMNFAYSIASIAKVFVSTSILSLEQKGLLKTNDKIAKYLNFIPNDKKNITLHQILTHTSGLGSPYWDDKSNRNLSEEEYILKTLKINLMHQPGSRFAYSNFGYHLLKKVVESITNRTFRQYLKEEFFNSNGIQETGLKDVVWKKNQVSEYDDWTMENSDKSFRNPLTSPDFLSNDMILSTTKDLYTWSQLLFKSNKILNDKSKHKLMTVELNNYAYGLEFRKSTKGSTTVYHGGYDSWFGMVTGMYRYVDEDITIIYLGNTHMDKKLRHRWLFRQIEKILFNQPFVMPKSANYNTSKSVSQFIGLYEKKGQRLEIKKDEIRNKLIIISNNKAVIKELIFPSLENENKFNDKNLDFIFKQINQTKFNSWKSLYFENSDFDKMKKSFQKRWPLHVKTKGKFLGIKVLHRFQSSYKGLTENELFTEIIFKKESIYYRIFQNDKGQYYFQNYAIPNQIELYLSESKNDEFLTWSLLLNSQSTIKFIKNKLVLNHQEEEFIKLN